MNFIKENQEALNLAISVLTVTIFNNLNNGCEINLTDKYLLYRYSEEDIYVISESNTYNEVLQVMLDNEKFTFEVL